MTDRPLKRSTDPAPAPNLDSTLQPEDLPPPQQHTQEADSRVESRFEGVAVGESIHGFELLRELGRGSFASVFLARQTALDRLVALKVSPNRGQEARTLAGLEHDHIVRVFSEEIAEHDLCLMCMQYVPGTTLAQIIHALHAQPLAVPAGQAVLNIVESQSTDPVPLDIAALRDRERLGGLDLLETVCWMGARLAEALAYAHARGVLHRDIKPANILVNRYGRPLLADFNVAASSRIVPSAPAHSTTSARPRPTDILASGATQPAPAGGAASSTRAGKPAEAAIGGTLSYMAPEHIDAFNPDNFTSAEAVDARSDIFSLGVVLFEFLTGRMPFDWPPPEANNELLQTLAEQRRAGPPPLDRDLAPAMLERILARCLAGQPSQRYANAADLAADLDSCRMMLRVQRQLPVGSIVTPLSLRWPFFVGAFLVLFPHILAGAANYAYNRSLIVDQFTDEEQQRMFLIVVLAYNSFIYPITIALYLQQVLPLVRLWTRLAQPDPLDAAVIDRARRQALRLPWWGIGLAAAGWIPAGFIFPLVIYLGSDIQRQEALHFIGSFTISGLIAMTYSVIAIEFIVVRVLYPGLWLDARNLRTVAQQELQSTERRLVAWQLMAVLIPLVGAAFMILGPEKLDWTYRLLVTGLLGLGMVGLGLALLAAGLLRETIAVLTSSGPIRSARPAPRDTAARTSTHSGS